MIKNIVAYLKKGGFLFLLLCIALILNHRMNYITLVGLFSILVFVSITIKTNIDKGALIIIAYTIFYILFSSFNGFSYSLSTLVLYAIAPFTFYQFGFNMVKRYSNENYIIMAWLIIIFCYCIDIFIITLQNYIETGMLINPKREFMFSDNSSSQLSATLAGLPMDIGMIGLPMCFIVKNNYMRFSFLLLFVLSLFTTFSLLNRTGLVVALLCFIIVIGYRSRHDIKVLMPSLLGVGVIFGLLLYFDIINTELIDFYSERNEDLSTMGSRTERWSTALGYLFTRPFGWAGHGQIYYVHNMWLDVARISGIIPFSLLAYIAYDSFRKAFRLVRRYESPLAYMILGLNVCFFASCFVEPIYGGTHMMLYCMLWGTSTKLLTNNSIQR